MTDHTANSSTLHDHSLADQPIPADSVYTDAVTAIRRSSSIEYILYIMRMGREDGRDWRTGDDGTWNGLIMLLVGERCLVEMRLHRSIDGKKKKASLKFAVHFAISTNAVFSLVV